MSPLRPRWGEALAAGKVEHQMEVRDFPVRTENPLECTPKFGVMDDEESADLVVAGQEVNTKSHAKSLVGVGTFP